MEDMLDLNDLTITGWLGINSQNLGNHEFSGTANFFYVTTTNLSAIDAFSLVTDSVHRQAAARYRTQR